MINWFKDRVPEVLFGTFFSMIVLIGCALAWRVSGVGMKTDYLFRYNECLNIILAHGGIADAEVMCGDLRKPQ